MRFWIIREILHEKLIGIARYARVVKKIDSRKFPHFNQPSSVPALAIESSESATNFNEISRTERILRYRFGHFCMPRVPLVAPHSTHSGTTPTVKSMHCVSIYLLCRLVMFASSPAFISSAKYQIASSWNTIRTHAGQWTHFPLIHMRIGAHSTGCRMHTHKHTLSPCPNEIFIKTTHAIDSTDAGVVRRPR